MIAQQCFEGEGGRHSHDYSCYAHMSYYSNKTWNFVAIIGEVITNAFLIISES